MKQRFIFFTDVSHDVSHGLRSTAAVIWAAGRLGLCPTRLHMLEPRLKKQALRGTGFAHGRGRGLTLNLQWLLHLLLRQDIDQASSHAIGQRSPQRSGQTEYASGYWPDLCNKTLTLNLGSTQPSKPNHSLCSNWLQMVRTWSMTARFKKKFFCPASNSESTRESEICSTRSHNIPHFQLAHVQRPGAPPISILKLSLSHYKAVVLLPPPLTLCQVPAMEAGCLAVWHTRSKSPACSHLGGLLIHSIDPSCGGRAGWGGPWVTTNSLL